MDTDARQNTYAMARHRRQKDDFKKLLKRPLFFLLILLVVCAGSMTVFAINRSMVALVLGCSIFGALLLSLPSVLLGFFICTMFDTRPTIRMLRCFLSETHVRQYVWEGFKASIQKITARELDPYERSAVIDRVLLLIETGDLLLGDDSGLLRPIITDAIISVGGNPIREEPPKEDHG